MLITACLFSFFFLFLSSFAVLILIPPLVFAHPDFGLEVVGDSVATQAKIAQAVSLTVTASSALTVVGLLVTYQLLQRIAKLSDFVILLLSGILLAITTGLHGFASKTWHFALAQGFFGTFLGPFLGAFINFKNPYVLNLFPNDMAAANSIYQVRFFCLPHSFVSSSAAPLASEGISYLEVRLG